MNRPLILVVDTVWHTYRDLVMPLSPLVLLAGLFAGMAYDANDIVASIMVVCLKLFA